MNDPRQEGRGDAGRIALERAEWQPILFRTPNRADLASCRPSWPCATFAVRVHRNHGFEPVSSGAAAYAAWNALAFDWSIGGYDDTLTFALGGKADVDLIWLDTERVRDALDGDLVAWLIARLRALRASTENPIVVLAWPLTSSEHARLSDTGIAGLHIGDLEPLAARLGPQWLDPRTQSLSGTRLGNRACLEVARELVCCWLPAAVLPPLKAIATDLDGTLYDGVLGEVGPAALEVTSTHLELQRTLRAFRADGGLLAIVSRNEPSDIEALFTQRRDLAVELSDFVAVESAWDGKAAALERVATRLRIATSAIAFVDDNPGALVDVATGCGAPTVYARAGGGETAAALSHVAGAFRWRRSAEDALRAEDLRQAGRRDALLQAADSEDEYFRSLRVELEYHVGARLDVPRAAELSAKTNQFNLSLRRMPEAEIAARLDEQRQNVVTVRLVDRMSNSGIVGVVVGESVDATLRIDELCVSCRALGRRLEDAIVTQAILLMAEGRAPSTVSFDVRDGPRNAPARDWLARYAQAPATGGGVAMPFDEVKRKGVSAAIRTVVVR